MLSAYLCPLCCCLVASILMASLAVGGFLWTSRCLGSVSSHRFRSVRTIASLTPYISATSGCVLDLRSSKNSSAKGAWLAVFARKTLFIALVYFYRYFDLELHAKHQPNLLKVSSTFAKLQFGQPLQRF